MAKAVKSGSQKEKQEKGKGALFIPAGLFLGMGIGFFSGNFIAGLFFGLGAGFLVFAVVNLLRNKK